MAFSFSLSSKSSTEAGKSGCKIFRRSRSLAGYCPCLMNVFSKNWLFIGWSRLCVLSRSPLIGISTWFLELADWSETYMSYNSFAILRTQFICSSHAPAWGIEDLPSITDCISLIFCSNSKRYSKIFSFRSRSTFLSSSSSSMGNSTSGAICYELRLGFSGLSARLSIYIFVQNIY